MGAVTSVQAAVRSKLTLSPIMMRPAMNTGILKDPPAIAALDLLMTTALHRQALRPFQQMFEVTWVVWSQASPHTHHA